MTFIGWVLGGLLAVRFGVMRILLCCFTVPEANWRIFRITL